MNDRTLTRQVRRIMAETFGVDETEISENPIQTEFAAWTSIQHMVLLVALEEQFGLTFSMDEMTSATSLDKIVAVLRSKISVAA